MSATDLAIDHDIEEMLSTISEKSLQKRLIVFNDDHHGMDEVVIQILLARKAGGQPCKPEDAVKIMMNAHKQGQAVVMSGDLENLKKARMILEAIDLRADIID